MSWSGDVKIHNVPGTGYPGTPAIYAHVTVSDVWRDNNTLYCDVSASLNAMGQYSYFGYYIRVYAQLDDGSLVQLFYKPNSPSRWNGGVYSGSARLYSTNNTTSCFVNIYFQSNCGGECTGSPNPYKMAAIQLWAPALPAPTINAGSTGFTADTVSWWATSNYDCDSWAYSLDGGDWQSYYGGVTSAPGTISVSSDIHRITIFGRRSGVVWGRSSEVYYDCRIPQLNNATVTPLNNTQGTLKFNTNFNVNYYWNNTYMGTGQNDITVTVPLSENSLKDYTLRVERTDNIVIQNSRNISVNTKYADISLTTTVSGLDVSFNVTSSEICNNWYLKYTWTDSEGVQRTDFYRADVSYTSRLWQGTLSNLTPNIRYNITAYGTRTDNRAQGYSNTMTVTPTGCVRIFDEALHEYRPIGVYIFTEGRWQVAIPYVYTNGQWEMCQ